MLKNLEIKEWLNLNAKLQQKKNNLRKLLSEKGILKKEGNNIPEWTESEGNVNNG